MFANQKNPDVWVKIIIGVNIVYYIISLIVIPEKHAGLWGMLAPSGYSLFILGGSGSGPVWEFGRFFSLVNANFLHVSLLHILFNMVACWQLFRPVCWTFGSDRAIVIYLGAGIFSFFVSSILGVQFTVGASGAVCGLMGALLYFGKARGDLLGQKLFKEILVWMVILFIFGFTAGGVNNIGHAAGIVMGVLLGWFLGFRTRETRRVVAISNTLLVISLICLLYSFLPFFINS